MCHGLLYICKDINLQYNVIQNLALTKALFIPTTGLTTA